MTRNIESLDADFTYTDKMGGGNQATETVLSSPMRWQRFDDDTESITQGEIVTDGGSDETGLSKEPTRDDLVDELRRLDAHTETYPRRADLANGPYDSKQYYEEFESWDASLAAADIDKRERLLAVIRRVGEEEGKRPTIAQVAYSTDCAIGTFKSVFDDWGDALDEAFQDDPSSPESQSEEEEITNQQTTSDSEPDTEEENHVAIEFDSLPASDPTRENLLDAILLVADASDHPVKSTDVTDKTPYSVHDYSRHFESWQEALKKAGVDNRSRLIDEIRRVANEIGHRPSTSEMNKHAYVSASFYQDYFDTYSEAVTTAFPEQSETGPSGTAPADDSGENCTFSAQTTTTIESISNNGRLAVPIVVRVIGQLLSTGGWKEVELQVEDVDGSQTQLNIWKAHELGLDWTDNHWYVLTDARGKYWEDTEGERCRQLNSTEDLQVEDFGTSRPTVDVVKENVTIDPGDGRDDDGILDDVMREFDNMEDI